jgi:hypothetical protein
VDALCSRVFVVHDRVLPLTVRAFAVRCAGIGNPEPRADLRPGRALRQGGSHRPGEEFLAQLSGRGELSAIVVSVLPPPILMVDWRHLRDCIGPHAGDETTFARGESRSPSGLA